MADQWVRCFSVADPQRHTKGFTVYRVSSTVFPRKSPEAKTEVVVWKRFSEFQKLHKELKSRHEKLYLKDAFPCFSQPCLFGRFDSGVIEERRRAAQILLDFIANHPPLFMSEFCVKFFEKSHNVILGGVLSTDQQNKLSLPTPLLPLSPVECDGLDSLSQSSSQSTITDTDSAVSIFSSPSQVEESSQPTTDSVPGTAAISQSSFNCRDKSEKSAIKRSVEGTEDASSSCHVGNVEQLQYPSMSEQSHVRAQHTSVRSSTDISSDINAQDSLNTGKSNSEDDSFQSSMVMDYITRAGYHIGQAVEYETNSQYEGAFASYKAAISSLLSGIQDDPSEDRRSMVQRKASQYLLRAEQIYHDHLDMSHNTTTSIPGAIDIPADQIALGKHTWKTLESPISDLQTYKVLGIVSTVILSLNTFNDSPYIIKVLHKSSYPVERRTKSIVPCNVPFMCRLYTFMENDCAVFLVLEQARGGRLWDYISPYFEHYDDPESSKAGFTEFLSKDAIANGENKSNKNENCLIAATDNVPENNQLEEYSFENSHLLCSGIETSSKLRENRLFESQKKGQGTSAQRQMYGIIPDVVLQKAPCVRNISPDIPVALNAEETHCKINAPIEVADTANILRSSQKLLDSVNNTLSRSEEATQALLLAVDGTLLDCQQKGLCGKGSINRTSDNNLEQENLRNESFRCLSKEQISSGSRDRKRSASKDRKLLASRRPRSRLRFSCDDMFEGRARALSRSLDREALHIVDTRVDKSTCPGLPIDTVRLWAAQLLLAIDALHRWGVIVGDLRPDNLLIGCGLNLVLTYQCQWICVDRVVHTEAIEQLYAAPEVGSIQAMTAAADWWSYGAILFELLSGETLHSCHPGGFQSYSNLYIPTSVSEEGTSLLRQLLKFDARSRLGAGPHGVAKLKAHCFFRGVEWSKILLMSVSAC